MLAPRVLSSGHCILKRGGKRMSQIGTLQDVKLADVLRLFAAGRKSGLLTVSAGGRQALVRFQRGSVVHAVAGKLSGDEAVMSLFGWKEGQLTFVPEERVVAANVTRPLETLIDEGQRSGPTLLRMKELLPSDRVVFALSPGPSADDARIALGPAQWRLVRLLDGTRDVRDLIEQTKQPRADVQRTLFELADGGWIERVELGKSVRVKLEGKDGLVFDERLEQEWMRVPRFSQGVHRVELRTPAGRTLELPASFRAGLFRDVHVPKGSLGELGAREGDDVTARPVA
jgi:hypothetical protein